jgi:BirA family transcriptional regulator, biotin operon repressor / biotin---[acetyl-CoA-carboxylase] ligase
MAQATNTTASDTWLCQLKFANAERKTNTRITTQSPSMRSTVKVRCSTRVSLPTVGEGQVLRFESVTSTQDVARELPIGTIVLADHQTAGRGRLDRRWQAPPGTALLVSFVLPPNPVLSLAAGVAAAEACGDSVRLKWPNDLLLDGRKLGGILVEAKADRAICGIGVNLTWAPEGAAQLNESRDELFARLGMEIDRWAAAPTDAVLGRWRELSATLGRRVRIDGVEGTAEDIGPRGELIVDGVAYVTGSVTHL